MKSCGPLMERSTCVSAAKLTTASAPRSASPTTAASQMSPVHEGVAGVVLDVAQVLEVAGVGELVEVDDLDVVVLGEHVAHEVGADEAGAAGDHESHADPSLSAPPTRAG